jgi:REP element-mobilizing transposase RayT
MSRPLRIEYPGAIYHVTSRGIDRREIYKDDKDREHGIQLLNEGADFFRVEVISYVLMSNHFHFLLRTKEANLSRFMQRLNVAYTRYYNHKYRRVGPLMQGRYKAIVVGSDTYFMTLSRYIHLNPVQTKRIKVKSRNEKERILMNYKWSSYPGILDPKKRSRYFNVEEALRHNGGDTPKGRNEYRSYVEEGLDKCLANPVKEAKFQLVLGCESFIDWVKEKFIKGKDLKPYPTLRESKGEKNIRDIAERVSRICNIDARELLKKKSKYTDARNIVIELAYLGNIHTKSLTDIGKEAGGISGSAVGYVHRRMQEKLKENSAVKKIFTEAGERLSILET